ncbi:DNA polymerase I [Tatumella ptyseos]|uniref:DNA polymerase I n=1 Tax=Tatumella ptyseos TaxID=82987 RepID=A0A2X5NV98_9GAMM|nr:DNA polymerase I [Tatumella ptyseos]
MVTIYDNLDKVASLSFRGAKTMAAKLEQNKDVAFLSYQLATIKTDVAELPGCEALGVNPPDNEVLLSLFSRYEFKRWISEVDDGRWLDDKKPAKKVAEQAPEVTSAPAESTLSTENYVTILDEQTFETWLEKLNNCELFAFDLETDSLDTLSANIVGFLLLSPPVKQLTCRWLMIISMRQPSLIVNMF